MTNKTKHIVAAVLNGVVAAISIFAIVSLFVLPEFVESDASVDHIFFLFSLIIIVIGALTGLISSIVSLATLKEDSRIVSLIRSISVVASLILVSYELTAILVSGSYGALIGYGFIVWVAAVAAINIASYCGFEVSYKKSPWYGAISGILYLAFAAAALLPMWDIKNTFAIVGTSDVAIYVTMAVVVVVSVLFGIVFVAINNAISKILTILLPADEDDEQYVPNTTNVSFTASEQVVEGPSDDVVEETKDESGVEIIEASEDTEEEEEAAERKQAAEDKKNNYEGRARVYHISKHQTSGKWQVKLATGKKAIKLFRTQAEAIAYAKELIGTQGGSIRIHSLKGKLRKEH